MIPTTPNSTAAQWARFRFSVVGSLLSSPPARGSLKTAIRSLAAPLAQRLCLQHHDHPDWSYQLHYDNLAALVKVEPALGRLPSYATIKRYMQAHGLVKKPRFALQQHPGQARAEQRRQAREIRSYEATH